MLRTFAIFVGCLLLVVPGTGSVELAYDMVDSQSLNLLDFTNFAPVFTSPDDAFGKLRVGVSPDFPPTLVDDSLSGTPTDVLGIIETNADFDEFFGICDTDNPDTGGAAVSAAWTFDISGGTATELCLDMAAMGDFEASTDSIRFEIQVDGAFVTTDALPFSVDEDVTQDYTMANGAVVTLADPAQLDGTLLSDVLRTLCTPVPAGESLILTMVANADGGNEGVVVRNIVVRGGNDLVFADGFEDGTTGAWSSTKP